MRETQNRRKRLKSRLNNRIRTNIKNDFVKAAIKEVTAMESSFSIHSGVEAFPAIAENFVDQFSLPADSASARLVFDQRYTRS